jgi:hypothetical protein
MMNAKQAAEAMAEAAEWAQTQIDARNARIEKIVAVNANRARLQAAPVSEAQATHNRVTWTDWRLYNK